jgi:hypothetical protein
MLPPLHGHSSSSFMTNPVALNDFTVDFRLIDWLQYLPVRFCSRYSTYPSNAPQW